jgi:hypothetical protein
MSMREQIKDIIDESVAYDYDGSVSGFEDAADAILAALPDMIAPLVWEEPCQQNNRCHIARTRFGDYYVDVCGGRHQAWMESHTKPYEVEIGDFVGDLYAAEAAANTHHRATIMAAFTGETS